MARRRSRRLAPGTWQQALAEVVAARPGRLDDTSGHPAAEIAIYPDAVWLAARSLRRMNQAPLSRPGQGCETTAF